MPRSQASILQALTSGLVIEQAWQVLSTWLETANPAHLNGWLALYFEQPEALRGQKSFRTDDTPLGTVFRQLAKGPLTDETTLFLLHDGSSLAIFKNQPHLELAAIQNHVEGILYESHTCPAIILYDLAIQLNELRMLYKRKQPPVSSKNAPMTKPLDDRLLKTALFQQSAKTRAARGKLNVLLVEDDKMITHLLQRTLKDYDVAAAHTAADGLEMYSRSAPDICFMDIGLPDHSGLDLLRIIHDNDPAAFIIMLTANSSEQNFHSSVSQGIKGFIAKPFTLSKISHYIEAYEKTRR